MIIGAQKAGTTSLFDYLKVHPDIAVADVKEVNYFSFKYERGLDWYSNNFDTSRSIALDASPQYLHEPKVAERLAKDVPDAFLVCVLRDPIERALSNYRFNLSRGLQNPDHSFSEVLKTPFGEETYLRKGLYSEQLARFAEHKQRNRLMLINFGCIKERPVFVLAKICEFVGIPADDIENFNSRISNETAAVGGLPAKMIFRAIQLKNANKLLYEKLPRWVHRALHQLKEMAAGFGGEPRRCQTHLDEETLRYLKAYFAEDVAQLASDYPGSFSWASRYVEDT